MDSKILCVSLLLAVCYFCSIEAGVVEDHDSRYEVETDYVRQSEDTRGAINEHTAKVASLTARNYANKAKAKEAEARLYAQCAKERYYYAREYNRLAEKTKQRAREYEQLAYAEASRVGQHKAKQREWESKSREAETQCKTLQQEHESYYTKSREAKRSAILASTEAAIHSAQAGGDLMKAERANDFNRELKRRAESILNDAKSHYMRGKEDENKATAEKVKAHQQAEDSQRHLAASRAYQQEALRTRLSSRSNIMKYIQNSLLAQRHQCLHDLEKLKYDMSHRVAAENARISEECGGIQKNLHGQGNTYASKAKQNTAKAYEYGESKKLMGTEMADAGELLYMAQAKDESPDVEGHQNKLSIYPAEDPVKAMPSEDKQPMFEADEGMS